ncbi:MAG: hypothetical protein FWB95_08495 [Treponema sp.]|nr:hypothetical protein [Treponema sp.]
MRTAVSNNDQDSYNNNVEKPVFQVFSQRPKLPVSRIEYKDLKLEFIKPYPMTIKAESGYLVHENMKMNLIVNGRTLEELVEEFFSCIYFLWHDIVLVDESELHSSAIKLKQYLLSLAKEIG